MLRQHRAQSHTANPALKPLARKKGENNLQWGERAVAGMKTGGADTWSYVVLLGADDTTAFRLRVAQSHLRHDMLPSYWSDAMLVKLEGNSTEGGRAIHVPLLQPGPPVFAPRDNGVVDEPLSNFADPVRYPNIALIALPTPQAPILKRLEEFKRGRSTLDVLEHVLRWLAFSWGSARTPNPLFENYGIPSACMLEIACAAEQFDLTPGLDARASCPEAIWAAARHWHKYYEEVGERAPQGCFFTPHAYGIFDPHDTNNPPPASSAPTAAKRKP